MNAISAEKRGAFGFLLPALLVVFCLIVVPLCCLAIYSFWSLDDAGLISQTFTLSTWTEFFLDSYYVGVLLKTLRLAVVSTIICALVGYAPAYFLTTLNGRARTFMIVLLFLPSWISYVVRTMAWLPILGRTGLLNTTLVDLGLLKQPIQLLYNDYAVYLGMVHFMLPVMILNIYIGLQTVDKNVVAAARTLGATSSYTFVTVTFPLALPGLAAGCLLCFVLSTGAYITPMILGGPGSKFFSNMLFETIITQLDWPLGAALSLILISLLLLLIYVYGRLIGLATITKSVRA